MSLVLVDMLQSIDNDSATDMFSAVKAEAYALLMYAVDVLIVPALKLLDTLSSPPSFLVPLNI